MAGFDYGSAISSLADHYSGSGGNWWDSMYSSGGIADWGTGTGGSSGGGWWNTIKNWFGGSSGSSSGSGVNWSQALLSGLGSAADAYASKANTKEAAEETGKQQRKTAGYTAALQDFYAQQNKARKRVALDQYGQFSLTSKFAPNMTGAPAVVVPAKPDPGSY